MPPAVRAPAPGNAPAAASVAAVCLRLTEALSEGLDPSAVLEIVTDGCRSALGVPAAAALLAGPGADGPTVAATAGDEARLLAHLEVRSGRGPATSCLRSGTACAVDDLRGQQHRWPAVARAAALADVHGAHALPIRVGRRVVGVLLLLGRGPQPIRREQVVLARSFLTVAASMLQQEAVHEAEQVAGQLQQALTSRLAIEQAKGVLAERHGLPVEVAFAGLRRHARDRNLKLPELARAVVHGDVDVAVERRSPVRQIRPAGPDRRVSRPAAASSGTT